MRRIDEKHHIDGDKLIKTTNGQEVPLDEPTILFRGRDKLALPMLKFYYQLCKNDNATEYQLGTLTKMIKSFENYSLTQPQVMKQPGITLGK